MNDATAITLTEPWIDPPPFDFDVRMVSSDTLSQLLRVCEAGSPKHVALIREQQRRRVKCAE